jgi:hypothetical protein
LGTPLYTSDRLVCNVLKRAITHEHVDLVFEGLDTFATLDQLKGALKITSLTDAFVPATP